jgi:hypothetical protein
VQFGETAILLPRGVEVGSVLFFAMTGLVLLPFALTVVAVVSGALSKDPVSRTSLVWGGALSLVLWSATVALSQLAILVPLSGGVSEGAVAFLASVAYAPYLILALVLLTLPRQVGLAVFRRFAPSRVRVLEGSGSTAIWVTGLRTLGVLGLLAATCAVVYFVQPLF